VPREPASLPPATPSSRLPNRPSSVPPAVLRLRRARSKRESRLERLPVPGASGNAAPRFDWQRVPPQPVDPLAPPALHADTPRILPVRFEPDERRWLTAYTNHEFLPATLELDLRQPGRSIDTALETQYKALLGADGQWHLNLCFDDAYLNVDLMANEQRFYEPNAAFLALQREHPDLASGVLDYLWEVEYQWLWTPRTVSRFALWHLTASHNDVLAKQRALRAAGRPSTEEDAYTALEAERATWRTVVNAFGAQALHHTHVDYLRLMGVHDPSESGNPASLEQLRAYAQTDEFMRELIRRIEALLVVDRRVQLEYQSCESTRFSGEHYPTHVLLPNSARGRDLTMQAHQVVHQHAQDIGTKPFFSDVYEPKDLPAHLEALRDLRSWHDHATGVFEWIGSRVDVPQDAYAEQDGD
jgi:hypothetical protein